MCKKPRIAFLKWFVENRLWSIALVLSLLCSGFSACTKRPPEGMVLIHEGTFTMGTDETDIQQKALEFGIIKPWYEDERPAHQVSLPNYYLDKYEVTNADYQRFAVETGHRSPPYWNGTVYPVDMDRYPVVLVSWKDAQSYCQWAKKRLPTEAEWEKAARPDQRSYPWGNQFDPNRANVGGIRGGLTPVGSYEAGQSPYGIFDLVGNVWEWTADWYSPYPGNPVDDENIGQNYKVLRGSSWAIVGHYPPEITRQIIAHNSRATFRLYFDPQGMLNDIGFRCAKST
jgi:formylglycine-generating enzyme required for sulfatase activity